MLLGPLAAFLSIPNLQARVALAHIVFQREGLAILERYLVAHKRTVGRRMPAASFVALKHGMSVHEEVMYHPLSKAA